MFIPLYHKPPPGLSVFNSQHRTVGHKVVEDQGKHRPIAGFLWTLIMIKERWFCQPEEKEEMALLAEVTNLISQMSFPKHRILHFLVWRSGWIMIRDLIAGLKKEAAAIAAASVSLKDNHPHKRGFTPYYTPWLPAEIIVASYALRLLEGEGRILDA